MKSRMLCCLILPVIVGLCLFPARAADWTMLDRDGTRNAVSPEKNPPLGCLGSASRVKIQHVLNSSTAHREVPPRFSTGC